MEGGWKPRGTGRVFPQLAGKFTFVCRDVRDRSSAQTRYVVARFCRSPTLQTTSRDLFQPTDSRVGRCSDQGSLNDAAPRLWRALLLLSSHLVVAVVALIVIGGATRVMEAGLACPDWPLCYGTLLPGRQMNLQVFLEWFHRLDAFLVGVALLIQQLICLRWASRLPRWLPWLAALPLLLVALQGALGALTVTHLLASATVTAHLGTALLLLVALSGLHQLLASRPEQAPPLWWTLLSLIALVALFGQCLLGATMASQWAAEACLQAGDSCRWLLAHRLGAQPAAVAVVLLAVSSLMAGPAVRPLMPYVLVSALLVAAQVALGILTLRLQLQVPAVTIAHQLVAALLVALTGTIATRALSSSFRLRPSSLEVIHG